MDRKGQRLSQRIKEIVGQRKVNPEALGDLLADWPELAGWWPDVGDHVMEAVDDPAGLREVVLLLRRCYRDPALHERFRAAYHSRGRGAPAKLRLSRAVYQICEFVRRRDRVALTAAHEIVSAEVADTAARYFETTVRRRRVEVRLMRVVDGEEPIPTYLLPVVRVLLECPPPGFLQWLRTREETGSDPPTDPVERVKTRPWSPEAIREHDSIYRHRLRALRQLGLRRIGTQIAGAPPDEKLGLASMSDGSPVVRDDGWHVYDIQTDVEDAAPPRGDGSNRLESGHRVRSDKRRKRKSGR